jgi:hypothetical protein
MLTHNFGSSGHTACQRMVCRDGAGTWQFALVVGPFASENDCAAFEEHIGRHTAALVNEEHMTEYTNHVVDAARHAGRPCYTRRCVVTPEEEHDLLRAADPLIADLYMDMYRRHCDQTS